MNDTMTAPNPLLTGPILPKLLRFAAPNMVAMLATALAAVAETSYVSHFGSSALAAMAVVFPFVMLQTMLSGGAMGGGVSSAISRALGAGDTDRAGALAVHALWIALAAGVVFMVLILGFGEVLFSNLGAHGAALAQALAYSEMAFLGSIFIWLTNILSSVLRGAGNMAVPSITLITVSVAQVLLGGALGLGWGPFAQLGMRGVAAGSVIAYGTGALFLYLYLASGRARISLKVSATRVQRSLMGDILRVGLVACASPFQTVLTVLILTRLVAYFGIDALAGYGIGTRLEFLLVPIAFAIGVASVPMVGMAIGAGQIARARSVAWTAAAVAFVVLGGLGLIVAIAPNVWTHLFTQDAAVVTSASLYFLWAGPAYGLFGFGLSLYFSSLAAGKAVGPVVAGTLRLVVVAVGGALLAYFSAPAWMIFALVSIGMAVYGVSTALFVRYAAWGQK